MGVLEGALGSADVLGSTSKYDDRLDKLHYYLTPTFLIAASLIASFKQFGGTPMECMVPDTFSYAWEQVEL